MPVSRSLRTVMRGGKEKGAPVTGGMKQNKSPSYVGAMHKGAKGKGGKSRKGYE